jgi:membrane fusion protein, multidrug efflux system
MMALLLTACEKQEPKLERPTPAVEVAEVAKAAIPIFIEAIGHVVAFNQAEIKSRIEGEVMAIHYEQGAIVKEGERLLTVDPRPYVAKLEETKGQLMEDQANLIFAKEKVQRYSTLVGSNYVSKLDYDQYVTDVAVYEGAVVKDQGAVANAQLNLDYCYITAPFTGRVGKKLVDIGNLVANDGSTLVTLVQTSPIYVDFSIPERDLLEVLEKSKMKALTVEASIPQTDAKPVKGELILIDNLINTNTGMIQMRGQFTNEAGTLWPGQFVKVYLVLEEAKDAVLIPQAGVNIGQKGAYALIVNEEHTVENKPIVTGEKIGNLIQVTSGLECGEYVVTTGQLNIGAGSKVTVKKVDKNYLKQLKKS